MSAPPRAADGPPASLTTITLRSSFSYVHEPFASAARGVPVLGEPGRNEELLARLLHSRGGTFLITGFRGVGKTTAVLRTLDEAKRLLAPDTTLIPVVLNVGRPITTDQLLFAVVRRLFEVLDDRGILMRLPPRTRQSLLLAYLRTSMSFKQTQTRSTEHAAALDLGSAGPVALPKLGLSAKRTRSAATEAAFLAYSQTDVEYDLVRIVRLVNEGTTGDTMLEHDARPPRHLPPWRRRPRVKLVVVLDELDKLTSSAKGFAGLERLLGEIKNVLAMPGVHFLLVAGVELHDAVVKDAARGNGVYESVIAWRQYIPCTWDAAESLVYQLVETLQGPADGITVTQLVQYLRFKARGVLRRLFQEFNALVDWSGHTPYLKLTAEDQERIAFYARLQTILDEHLRQDTDKPLFSLAIDEDRWRLGGYYLVDWVLRSNGQPITAADALRAVEDKEIDPLLRITQHDAERLLAHLADHHVLDPLTTSVIIGDVRESSLPTYKLAANIKASLLDLARESEQERAALFTTATERPTTGSAQGGDELAHRLLGERYQLLDVIGRGGLGTVYRGIDTLLGRQVAIKTVGINSNDPVLQARFAREARITATLDSPRIVRVYDVVSASDDPPTPQAIIMELIEGPNLDAVLEAGPLDPQSTVQIGIAVAEALDYLATHGISRIDIKPSNILMHPTRGPVVIDLGIAKRREPDHEEYNTLAHVVVGTPAYMAPEQFTDAKDDIRSDIYSLGSTMYTCLTRKTAFDGFTPERFTRSVDVTDLPGSPALRDIIATAMAINPDERFPTPTDLITALRQTPEAQHPSPQD